MKARQWIAWKLVQVAHRIYDAEWYEHIVITDEYGQRGEFVIVCDAYGCGVSSYNGPSMRHFDPDTWEYGSCDVVWEEFQPDYLEG